MRKEGTGLLSEIKSRIRMIVAEHVKIYILLIASFGAGFLLAAMVQGNSSAEEEIKRNISEFFFRFSETGTSGRDIFFLSMASYIRCGGILMISAFSVVGAPLVPTIAAVYGFSYGTVICGAFSVFGIKALLIFLCAVLPHGILFAPCYLLYSCCCLQNACRLFSGDRDVKRNVISPVLFGVLFLLGACVAALVQAYIEPFFLSLISQYFV